MKHRSRTIRVRQMTKLSIEIGRQLFPETDHRRPQTRAECVDGPRPCPYVSCKYHLYLDVQPRTGAIKLNFPDIEVEEMKESCALDVADRGGVQLQELGALTNLTRERVRQLEVNSLVALGASQLIDLRSLLPGRERYRPELAPALAEEEPPPPVAERAGYRRKPGQRHWQILDLLGTRTLSGREVWRELQEDGHDLDERYVLLLLSQLVTFGLAERPDRRLYRAREEKKEAAE